MIGREIELTTAIPALGAEAGDLLLLYPEHPRHPVVVMKRHGREALETMAAYGIVQGPDGRLVQMASGGAGVQKPGATADPAFLWCCKHVPQECGRAHILAAGSDIPGTIVRGGDVLLVRHRLYDRSMVDATGALVLRVPRSQLRTVEEHFDRLRVAHTTDPDGIGAARQRLRRKSGPKAREDTGVLFLLRPLVSPVSRPVVAASDAGALFELLAQVGGRMPPA